VYLYTPKIMVVSDAYYGIPVYMKGQAFSIKYLFNKYLGLNPVSALISLFTDGTSNECKRRKIKCNGSYFRSFGAYISHCRRPEPMPEVRQHVARLCIQHELLHQFQGVGVWIAAQSQMYLLSFSGNIER
jgi:hypothetical protein